MTEGTGRGPAVLALLALLAGAACGGGGGGGDPGDPDGVSRGVITQTGSARVARTLYDTDTAEVLRDGVAGGTFSVGEKVTVTGTRDGDTGIASQVAFDDEIEGPVDSVTVLASDLDGADVVKELVILGQSVEIEAGATVFDGTDFASVAMGDVVEVSGFHDGEGRIQATRVRLVPAPGANPRVELRGDVDDLMPGASFELGGTLVTFDGDTVVTGTLAEGAFVEAVGEFDAGSVDATGAGGAVRVLSPIAGDVDVFEIEGVVRDFASLASFTVDGQPVNATGLNIVFDPSECSAPPPFDVCFVEDGVLLEVEGELVDGLLLPTTVTLRDAEVRIAAALDAVDAAAGTLELLGIDVRTDAATRYEGCEADPLGGLAQDDRIAVRGIDLDDGDLPDDPQVLATHVRCNDATVPVVLRGRLDGFVNPGAGDPDGCENDCSFEILGVEIATDVMSTFLDFPGMPDEDGFYAFLATNDRVLLAVEGRDMMDPVLDLAGRVKLEE